MGIWKSGGRDRGGEDSGPEPGWIVRTENSHLSTSYFIVSISFIHEDQRELDIGWGFLFDFAWRGIGPFASCKYPACWLLEACLE